MYCIQRYWKLSSVKNKGKIHALVHLRTYLPYLRKSGAPPPFHRENSNLFNYLKLNIIKLPKIDLGHPTRQIKLSPGRIYGSTHALHRMVCKKTFDVSLISCEFEVFVTRKNFLFQKKSKFLLSATKKYETMHYQHQLPMSNTGIFY